MPTIQRIFRCRIEWDGDQSAAHKEWLVALEHAEDNDLPEPEERQVYEEIGKEVDRITYSFKSVGYSDNGGGPCWNSYIILEGEVEEDVRCCAEMIEEVIQTHPFARLLEA